MVITELYIKNFGKFTEQHFYLKDGIQVICGENEFGKSTLHAFIRAMLFGLERGRGRAAAKDGFSRHEPWENPGYYAGVMRFSCGGRNFRLERNFARATRRAYLVCEDDGEELSVEQGDLNMLLGGMTPGLFDSTVSVGQLQTEPGQELYEVLENRAANYFETGSGEMDISAALRILREKQRDTEKAIREEEAAQEAEREKLRMECTYLERDMQALQCEYDEKQERLEALKNRKSSGMMREETETDRAEAEERETYQADEAQTERIVSGRSLIRMGLVGLLAGAAGFLWSFFLSGADAPVPSAPFAVISGVIAGAGILLLLAGVYTRSRERRDAGSRGSRTRERAAAGGPVQRNSWMEHLSEIRGEGIHDAEIHDAEIRDAERRIQGELDHIRSVWKDKEIRCGNLREQCEEYEPGDARKKLGRRLEALALAENELKSAAREMGDLTARTVNRRASEIFAAITDGAYKSLRMDEERHLSVWDGARNIPAERLSRGTIEQIYLAVRLAAADVLLEEPVPVILDDVFAFYDDKRLESALKWLSRQGKQVIIFTCHKREEEIVKRVVYS